jgi:hypothetical protein
VRSWHVVCEVMSPENPRREVLKKGARSMKEGR